MYSNMQYHIARRFGESKEIVTQSSKEIVTSASHELTSSCVLINRECY